jgi:hypothetical protein
VRISSGQNAPLIAGGVHSIVETCCDDFLAKGFTRYEISLTAKGTGNSSCGIGANCRQHVDASVNP